MGSTLIGRTGRRPVRVSAVLGLAMALVAVTCSGDDGGEAGNGAGERAETAAPAPDVGWSVVMDVATARRGEYRRVVAGGTHASMRTLLEEWVTYDLDVPIVERRVVPAVGSERSVDYTRTRDDPTVRYIYTEDKVYMWTADREASCGNRWVDIPLDEMARQVGAPVDPGDPYLDALEVLQASPPPSRPERSDDQGTVYVIDVPGGFTFTNATRYLTEGTDDTPLIGDRADTVEVDVARGGGRVDLIADVSPQPTAVPGLVEQQATLRWTITAPLEAVDIDVPTAAVPLARCEHAAWR